MLTLYTFAISHFSEKARWALDLTGVCYTEKLLLPGLHMLTTKRLAQASTVPLLVHGKQVIQGSSAILDYIHARIAPSPWTGDYTEEDRQLEEALDVALGLGAQRIFYSSLLQSRPQGVFALWSLHGPDWARAYYSVTGKLAAAFVSRLYKAQDEKAVARAIQRFELMLDDLDQRLTRSPYLSGDMPGRLDLVAAALLAPFIMPTQHPACWPIELAAIDAFTDKYRKRPAFLHMEKMYRESRFSEYPYRLGRGGAHIPLR